MKINLREIGKAPTLVVLNEMIDKFKRINGVDPVLVMNCKTWFKFIDIQTLNWWGDGNKESLPEGYCTKYTGYDIELSAFPMIDDIYLMRKEDVPNPSTE